MRITIQKTENPGYDKFSITGVVNVSKGHGASIISAELKNVDGKSKQAAVSAMSTAIDALINELHASKKELEEM